MGDRGNIVVRQEKDTNRGDVWFYTHWRGSDMKEVVQTALAKRQRWEDFSYLARIIFDELTDDDHGSETGFGISTRLGDNEWDILVVDAPAKLVYTIKEDQLEDGRLPKNAHGYAVEEWTFEQFIATRDGNKMTTQSAIDLLESAKHA